MKNSKEVAGLPFLLCKGCDLVDDLSIKIRGLLSVDKNDIEEQIRKLSGQIKERLELKLNISADGLDIINKQVEEVKKKIKTKTVTKDSLFINKEVEQQAFNEITARLREVKKNVDELAQVRTQYSLDEKGRNKLESATLTYYNKELGQTVNETMKWVTTQKEINGELHKTQTFRSVGLNISDDMAKAAKESEKLAQSIKDLNNYKLRMLGGEGFLGELDIFSSKNRGKFDKNALEKIKQDIASLTINTPDLNNKIKQLGIQFSSIKQKAADAGSVMTRSFENIFKFMRFYLLGGTIVKMINSLKDSVKYIGELDNALNQIRIVSGQSQQEIESLAISYNKLAQAMSVSTTEIAKAAVEFYRQGLNQEEVESRLVKTIQYAKISALSFDEAAQILTATVNSMEVDIGRAADVMAYLGDATATGSDEIGRAMQKVGGTAGALGIEYEKLASWISVVSSKTRESAESIGTSFKTILARLTNLKEAGFDEEDNTRINDVAIALSKVGISLTNSQGQFRDFGAVIDDLGLKWQDITDNKLKAYLATVIAGTRQQSRFYALMDGYKEVVELYAGALGAAGTSQDKYNIYLESTQAALDKLKSTGEGFWQKSLDAGTIKSAVNVLISLVNVLDNAGRVVAFVSSLFLAFKHKAIAGFLTGLKDSITSLFSFKKAADGAKMAVSGFERALGLLGIALTVATIAISAYNEAKEKQLQLAEETKTKLKEEQSALDDLKQSYSDIITSGDMTESSKVRLKSIQDQLIETYHLEANAIDLVNGKYEEQISIINQAIAKKAEQVNASIAGDYRISQAQLDNLDKTYAKLTELGRYESKVVSDRFRNVLLDVGFEEDNSAGNRLGVLNKNLEDRVEIFRDAITELSKYNDLTEKEREHLLKLQTEYNILNGEFEKHTSIVQEYVRNQNLQDFYNEFRSQISEVNALMSQLNTTADKTLVEKKLANLRGEITGLAMATGRLGDFKDLINDLFGSTFSISGGNDIPPPTPPPPTSTYTPITEQSALKKLYNAELITNEEYLQKLLTLEQKQFSDYSTKSAQEIQKLLMSKSETVSKRVQDYLSLKDAIEGAKDKLKKNMESLQSEAEKALKDYLEIERKLKEQTAQSTYEKKLSSAEKKIYGESQKAFEEASNARIEAYENEIKRLQEKSDLIQEQIDREKRLADIEKQKNIIANLQQQKTVRVYRDGQWVYEADQQKLIEARERLETIQQDYYEWENSLRRQRQIQALQDSIQFERQQQEEKRKSMERQKEILDAELKNEQLAIEQHYIDMDTLVSEGMDGLKDTYEEKWDEILEVLKDRLERAKSIQRQIELANLRTQQAALQIETTTTTKVTNQLVRDTGGKVPSGTSAINLSGKDETMLSPAATKAWIKLVDNLTDISRVFDVRSFRFPNFTPAMAGGGGTIQTYNIHIDRIETEDAQSFIDLLPTIVKQYK